MIKLMLPEDELPFAFSCKQFPVWLAFAITINKSQGQTFHHVGLYLEKPVFTHGMLYVGVSWVSRKDNLKIKLVNGEKQGKCDGKYYTDNVIYPEVLELLFQKFENVQN